MRLTRWILHRKWIALILGVILVWGSGIGVGCLVSSGGDSSDPPAVHTDSLLSPDSLLARLQVTPTPSLTPSPTTTPEPTQEPSPVVAEAIAPPEFHPAAPLPQSTPTPWPTSSPTPTPPTPPPPTPTPAPVPLLLPAEAITIVADWRDAQLASAASRVVRESCVASWDNSMWTVTCDVKWGYPCQLRCTSEETYCLFEATLTVTRCD